MKVKIVSNKHGNGIWYNDLIGQEFNGAKSSTQPNDVAVFHNGFLKYILDGDFEVINEPITVFDGKSYKVENLKLGEKLALIDVLTKHGFKLTEVPKNNLDSSTRLIIVASDINNRGIYEYGTNNDISISYMDAIRMIQGEDIKLQDVPYFINGYPVKELGGGTLVIGNDVVGKVVVSEEDLRKLLFNLSPSQKAKSQKETEWNTSTSLV